jgi:cytidylate kinase
LILVGVRNVSTIDGLLRSGTLHLRVLFLRAPLGLRARRYKKREGSNGLSYATLLKARTEAEHAAIERRADEIVKNGADLRSLELALAPSLRWLVGR